MKKKNFGPNMIDSLLAVQKAGAQALIKEETADTYDIVINAAANSFVPMEEESAALHEKILKGRAELIEELSGENSGEKNVESEPTPVEGTVTECSPETETIPRRARKLEGERPENNWQNKHIDRPQESWKHLAEDNDFGDEDDKFYEYSVPDVG